MKKLLKSQKFPSILSVPLDIQKVNLDVMRPWIAEKITTLLGFEDEILIEFIISLLEAKTDAKKIQIEITGFLESHTIPFMKVYLD